METMIHPVGAPLQNHMCDFVGTPVIAPNYTLIYGHKNITTDVAPYLLSLTYTDYLTDQSDTLEVELENMNGKWVREWWPDEGDKLELHLGNQLDGMVKQGVFEIDEIEYSEHPDTIKIKALATAVLKPQRTGNAVAYEKTTLAGVVGAVAARNGLTVVGEISDFPVRRMTQYHEHDVAFITRLGREYGHAVKFLGSQLVFTDIGKLGKQSPVMTLHDDDIKSLRLRDKIRRLPQQVITQGFDQQKKEVVSVVQSTQPLRADVAHPTSADTRKVVTRADNPLQIKQRTQGTRNQEEDDQCSGDITLVGNARIAAGVTVHLPNRGKFSGNYLVKTVRHMVIRGGGFETTLEVTMGSYSGDSKSKGKKRSAKPATKAIVKSLLED